ncbi:MAG: carbon starvation protein A, partial [Phycisphaerales bacterium]|nr:carbon starvation protein A [Phycisphaerales bacterium]
METVLIALGSVVLYVVAYRTYGRYLARRVFRLDPSRVAPSVEFEDGVDFVPSRCDMVFGHHFTSIAGTGPIVGPAVAVIWGWVPALLWVLIGSIVMGAVHDFGSLVISMRHQGRTIGDLAGDVIGPRVRLLFLLVVLIGLWIVLAVFGLVIATVFNMFESSIVPVFLQIPIAVALGVWIRRGGSVVMGTGVAVGLMYASIVLSAAWDWEQWSIAGPWITSWMSPNAFWTLVLLVYVFIASVLPVQTLLQPRDFINAYQLLIAMGLLLVGLLVARPEIVATPFEPTPMPATPETHVPRFFPFLFVTIACGAISGFHCMVSSGCSSRQLRRETDAQVVGYGAMLTEGFLAVLVILACVAGIGMGTDAGLVGREAWASYYATWNGSGGLRAQLTPFVRGSANMIHSTGISLDLAVAIMGVFVASFAATTLDSATRLQRYVITELGTHGRWKVPALGNRYVATSIAVVTAGALALSDAVRFADGQVVWNLAGAGKGGLV